MKLSEKIEVIIHVLDQSKADVRWYQEQQEIAEAEIMNLEHELEGVGVTHRSPPNSRERGKLATQYQHHRIKRRIAKDAVRVNQSLAKFVESDIGAKAVNQLRQILGEVRKQENCMDERVYGKRVAPENSPPNPDKQKKLNSMIKKWKKTRKK